MADGLTFKQAAFAAEYVHHKGNGTKAAKAAGYGESSAHVRASELVRNRKVKRAIRNLTRKYDITPERVLTRLDNLSEKAEKAGDYSTAAKCERDLGNALGMFVKQSVHLNVDASQAHLDALRALAAKRVDPIDVP